MSDKDELIERMRNEDLTDELVDKYLALPCEPLSEESEQRMVAELKAKIRAERKRILDEEFNDLLLDLYPLSVANGSIGALAQREFAEDVANHIGLLKERLLDRL